MRRARATGQQREQGMAFNSLEYMNLSWRAGGTIRARDGQMDNL
jgi:hypothetical protein